MKILWVDDEIDLLKSFVFFLEERNYDVDTCNNAMNAIEKGLENKYDMEILMNDAILDGLTPYKNQTYQSFFSYYYGQQK
jgi:DNA-binding response OmpR family regulator